MFKYLQTKWKVSGLRLLLIIVTFAVGGSLWGYGSKKLIGLTNIDKGFLWILVYVATVSILWPIAVLLTSIPLGQFFFLRDIFAVFMKKLVAKRKYDNKNPKTL